MKKNIRLWQRDYAIQERLELTPMTTSQIAKAFFNANKKKAAQRLQRHFAHGLVKRFPNIMQIMQGKPEYVYYRGKVDRHPQHVQHDLAIAEFSIVFSQWIKESSRYRGDFFFQKQLPKLRCGLIPDGVFFIGKTNQNRELLYFLEVDLGTESMTGNNYSLSGKLHIYEQYWDDGGFRDDFSWRGTFNGFRVLLLLSTKRRLDNAQQLTKRDGHDFVLLTTIDRLGEPFDQPIFATNNGTSADVFGREEIMGDLVRPVIPNKNEENQQ